MAADSPPTARSLAPGPLVRAPALPPLTSPPAMPLPVPGTLQAAEQRLPSSCAGPPCSSTAATQTEVARRNTLPGTPAPLPAIQTQSSFLQMPETESCGDVPQHRRKSAVGGNTSATVPRPGPTILKDSNASCKNDAESERCTKKVLQQSDAPLDDKAHQGEPGEEVESPLEPSGPSITDLRANANRYLEEKGVQKLFQVSCTAQCSRQPLPFLHTDPVMLTMANLILARSPHVPAGVH